MKICILNITTNKYIQFVEQLLNSVKEIDNYLSNYNFSRVETDWAGKLWGDVLYIKNR
jgi:hypothetical protein